MNGHDPFTGVVDRSELYTVGLITVTEEDRQRARLKVAEAALDAADCRLLLAALGLDQP